MCCYKDKMLSAVTQLLAFLLKYLEKKLKTSQKNQHNCYFDFLNNKFLRQYFKTIGKNI